VPSKFTATPPDPFSARKPDKGIAGRKFILLAEGIYSVFLSETIILFFVNGIQELVNSLFLKERSNTAT
jgi:hypothetical protein